ncbi:uncharacterized protein BCR38DRAFT_480147 [Pseudomassariella vexata]|uniref:Uncharacterized protein n=1 Tax=Pseudomassariella vexata TaxID=1141098 RepID=A0A1Y2EJC1_9PEZI|nr:uncharacterized protein BCR38DRAFT_480147 [Pseudomassariella vexata]ORY71651.1 hypothetical protein BCR38DRAFT_480147 [Pseudomassariella vexata]
MEGCNLYRVDQISEEDLQNLSHDPSQRKRQNLLVPPAANPTQVYQHCTKKRCADVLIFLLHSYMEKDDRVSRIRACMPADWQRGYDTENFRPVTREEAGAPFKIAADTIYPHQSALAMAGICRRATLPMDEDDDGDGKLVSDDEDIDGDDLARELEEQLNRELEQEKAPQLDTNDPQP